MKAQQQQIATLRQEVRSYQTSHHQNVTELVRKEVEKLEDTLLERINDGLAQHSAQESILSLLIQQYSHPFNPVFISLSGF